jgi:hypothetical protein
VTAFFALLLLAGAPDGAPSPAIRIDPCVEVDAEEVRRLAAIELGGWTPRTSHGALEVVVACSGDGQELRLTDRERARVTVRGIDLGAREAGATEEPTAEARDAKARELALAIAELVRRTDAEPVAPVPSAPRVPEPVAAPLHAEEPTLEWPDAWRLELAAAAVLVHWTGGETLFGADMTGRVRVARWLIAELRLGGRKTRPLDLEQGSIDGHGVAAAGGLAVDATPGLRRVGLSFGGRVAADWLRYAARDRGDAGFASKDAAGANLAATATAFVVLSDAWCVTADASFGTALHSIVIRENGQRLSAARGVFLSTAVALGGHF